MLCTHHYQWKVTHHTLVLCWKYFRKKNRHESPGRKENRISNLSNVDLQVMEQKHVSNIMWHSVNVASDIANGAWNMKPIVYVYTHKMLGKHWMIVSPQHSYSKANAYFYFGTAFHLAALFLNFSHTSKKWEAIS